MGTSIDPVFVERLQEDIKVRCEKLEKHGYESLVVMVCKSSENPYITGSQRGTHFLGAKDVFISEFMQFCTDDGQSIAKPSTSTYFGVLNTSTLPDDVKQEMFDEDTDDYDDPDNYDDYDDTKLSESMMPDHFWRKLDEKRDNRASVKCLTGQNNKPDREKGTGARKKVSEGKLGSDVTSQTSVVAEPGNENNEEAKKLQAQKQIGAPVDQLECHFCLQLFKTDKSLNSHIQLKHERNSKDMKCQQCCKRCESSLALGDHIAKEHNHNAETEKENFVCDQCSFVFSFKTHLVEHNQRNPECKAFAKSQTKSNAVKDNILQSEITFIDPVTNEVKIKTVKQLMSKKDSPSTCEICLKQFDRPYSFRRHIFQHSSAKHFKCIVCMYEFNMEESLKRHWKLHDTKPYYCVKCFERYETRDRLNHHLNISCKLITVKPELQCPECEYQAVSRSALENHSRVHTGAKDWSCEICGKELASRESLNRHQQVFHQDESPHECYECGKKYKTKDGLKKHTQIHGERKYKCDMCEYSAIDASSLKKHIQVHTKEKPFICDYCGKSYGRKTTLDNHRRLHTGERPYKCDFEGCDKAFRNPVNLRQHKCYHSTSYAYVCDFCGRSFKVRNAYKHHRRYHTVEFRWPCEYCDEKFKSRLKYKTHVIKTHPEKTKEIENKSNIRFFQCHLCTKMFASKEHLGEHVNFHMGLKPIKCRYCDKGFSSKGNMMQHEKSHTGGKKFRCSFCSKTYNDKEIFKQHLENKHSQKVDLNSLEEVSRENNTQDPKSAVKRMRKNDPVGQTGPIQKSTMMPVNYEENDPVRQDGPSQKSAMMPVNLEMTKFIHPGFEKVIGESYSVLEYN